MNVILFGASGMVGQGVLRECLLDSSIETVLSISRSPLEQQHPKLRELVVKDVGDLSSAEDQLKNFDACFFCLGVSSAGMKEADYRRVTYDLTLNAARTLANLNPGTMAFIYVSGASTDSTERGGSMWARVKGATENALLRLPFKGAFMFRPGVIQPLHGIKSKTKLYRILYVFLWPLLSLMKALFPKHVLTTQQLGRAMIKVGRDGYDKPILEIRDIAAVNG